jgi:hypothetical protein
LTEEKISGLNAEQCLISYSPPAPEDLDCKSWEAICTELTPAIGFYGTTAGNFVCDSDGTPNSEGQHCCFRNPQGVVDTGGVQDQAWTCANWIGAGTPPFALEVPFTTPSHSKQGYLCGPSNACKVEQGRAECVECPGNLIADGNGGCMCFGETVEVLPGVCGPPITCTGSACGDPHFQKWDGEWFDFHGECDMVFLEEPEFYDGLGLTIHIRTKARYDYSYIESVVVKIGDDVLQVDSFGEYVFNGVLAADLEGAKFFDLFAIAHEVVNKQKSVFRIDLTKAQVIEISTFKDLVAVRLLGATQQTFGNSVGVMGSFPEGKMLARDGNNVMLDPVEYGMEWQVRSEKSLFQVAREPQYPTEQCRMPGKNASAERRRLGERVEKDAAEAACAAVDHIHHDNCVYDVMATGDLEVAHAGVF